MPSVHSAAVHSSGAPWTLTHARTEDRATTLLPRAAASTCASRSARAVGKERAFVRSGRSAGWLKLEIHHGRRALRATRSNDAIAHSRGVARIGYRCGRGDVMMARRRRGGWVSEWVEVRRVRASLCWWGPRAKRSAAGAKRTSVDSLSSASSRRSVASV